MSLERAEYGTAVEQALADREEREWRGLERRARLLARSGLVPKHLRGKPEDVMAIALSLDALGLPVSLVTLGLYDVIEGRPEPRTQLLVAVAAAQGHELWEGSGRGGEQGCDAESATFYGRRRGSERVYSATFALSQAATAGLLDRWVEEWPQGGTKKVWVLGSDGTPPDWAARKIAAGAVRCRDSWHRYPADMLRWRAAKRLLRLAMPDVLLGIEHQLGAGDPRPVRTPPGAVAEVDALEAGRPTEVEVEDLDKQLEEVEVEDLDDAVECAAGDAEPFATTWAERVAAELLSQDEACELLRWATGATDPSRVGAEAAGAAWEALRRLRAGRIAIEVTLAGPEIVERPSGG